MTTDRFTDAALLLDALRRDGPLTAAELARRLGVSQPTLWRRLTALLPEVAVLGRGRATRYALSSSILGWPAAQPLFWIDADGRVTEWGELTWLANGRLHIWGPGVDLVADDLPWFLSPLRPQGFLGRLLGQRFARQGFAGNPDQWSLEQVLYAALQLPDPPGAFRLGLDDGGEGLPLHVDEDFDTMAADVAATLPAGSSAGGEQAKFLGRLIGGDGSDAVLVKFSPPRGTPFGDRWTDLLRAEYLAAQVLAAHGVPSAETDWRQTAQRSYLVSKRFDRLGVAGRRHAVPLESWRRTFAGDRPGNWETICTALARQRRVPPETPSRALALLQFGRLIGNTDMHSSNLSLWLEREDVARGRGSLAPVYDMLPMRWRPDPASGSLDLTPFTPDEADIRSPARPAADAFWRAVADDRVVSPSFCTLAEQMLERLRV